MFNPVVLKIEPLVDKSWRRIKDIAVKMHKKKWPIYASVGSLFLACIVVSNIILQNKTRIHIENLERQIVSLSSITSGMLETNVSMLDLQANSKQHILGLSKINDYLLGEAKNITVKLSNIQEEVESLKDVQDHGGSRDVEDDLRLLRSDIEVLKEVFVVSEHEQEITLPFKVVSLDYWNGIPRLAVSIAGEMNLVGKNQAVVGWTLSNIDMSNKVVEFKGENGQKMKVVV